MTKEENLPESVPGGYCLVATAKAFQAELAFPYAVCHTRGGQLGFGRPPGRGEEGWPGSGGAPGPKGGAESSTYCVRAPRWALACHSERHRQTAAREPLCMLTHRLCSPPSEVSLPVALGQKPFVSVWPWLGFWGKRWERGPRAVAGALGVGQWGPQV